MTETEDKNISRKLRAIIGADVVGYSSMMQNNEENTINLLHENIEVFKHFIVQYGGEPFGAAGDSIMASFESAVSAVRCAISIQDELLQKNTELPEENQMWFRIGINVGDVIFQGERVYGDGVNIAARMESLANPGGICVSGSVYEQVKNKLSFGFESLGSKQVKNIAEPIPVFSITSGVDKTSNTIGNADQIETPSVARKHIILIFFAIFLFVVIGFYGYKNTWIKPDKEVASSSRERNYQPLDVFDFSGKTITGTSKKNKPITIELNYDNSAMLAIYASEENKKVIRTESGRWFVTRHGMLCMKFENGKFANGEKFCRTVEHEEKGLKLIAPNPVIPDWYILK